MLKVGLTGEAGAGKSYVSKILREEFGIPVIDSDNVTRELMQPGQIVFNNVVDTFGEEYLDDEGHINRTKLARLVFNNEEMLLKLNNITHPATIDEIKSRIEKYESEGYKMVVIESAIALDSAYDDFCDEFWYVYADEASRRERLKENRGYSDEKIDSIISSQRDEKFFREHCCKVIENTFGATKETIVKQLKTFIH